MKKGRKTARSRKSEVISSTKTVEFQEILPKEFAGKGAKRKQWFLVFFSCSSVRKTSKKGGNEESNGIYF